MASLPPHLQKMAALYHPNHFDQGGTAVAPSAPSSPPEPNAQNAKDMQKGATSGGPSASQMWENLKAGFHAQGGPVWENQTPASVGIDPGAAVNLPAYVDAFPAKTAAPTKTKTPASDTTGGAATVPIGNGVQVLGANPEGGSMARGGRLEQKGGKVPGKMPEKDAYKNDTVDAKLTPGEVVIDVNTLKDKGKLGQMARFVAKEIERKKAGRKLI
jgi:hypothetical protein